MILKFIFKLNGYIFQRVKGFYPILILAGCGTENNQAIITTSQIGFSSDYEPPTPNYSDPELLDPYYNTLNVQYIEPYWVDALEMYNGVPAIKEILEISDGVLNYSFSGEIPTYLPVSIPGWVPANDKMITASNEIFSKLGEILDVDIKQTDSWEGLNVILISQSIQSNTAGFSYFPSSVFQLGSDIFISKEYSEPKFVTSDNTNYDYEVLIHEIGHALGLKHPFEADSLNDVILNTFEDQTKFTAMSYNHNPETFDGNFRVLDWMALTKLYGVSPSFNPENDIYKFKNNEAVFIIDGKGTDKIVASESQTDIYIDLRPGSHSYLGQKEILITAGNQLTISHGSIIEDVETGIGDDWIIGNEHDNTVVSSFGNDSVFLGDGCDTVFPGPGSDVIDLSESAGCRDAIFFDEYFIDDSFDTVYGFAQGVTGDVVKLKGVSILDLHVLPLIDVLSTPGGRIADCLLRIIGQNIDTVHSLETHLNDGGMLETLLLNENEKAIVMSANSQETGEAQNLFFISKVNEKTEVNKLAVFLGNYMDIDNWHYENFIV